MYKYIWFTYYINKYDEEVTLGWHIGLFIIENQHLFV